MKLKATELFNKITITVFLTGILSVRCLAQQISPQEKEQLFHTPETWQQLYQARLNSLPIAEQTAYSNTNAELVKGGHHFTVGPTILPAPLDKLVMHLTLPNWNQLPKPPPTPPVIQTNCLEILARPTAPTNDMRDYGIVTPIRTQLCGDCWDFGTVAALETSVLLVNGSVNGVNEGNLYLSEQQVLDCTGGCLFGNSCSGGSQTCAADYICSHPIVAESILPNQGTQGSCISLPSSSYEGANWGWVGGCSPPGCMNPGVQAIKSAICAHGSVISCIQATANFGSYSGGVFDDNDGACPGPWPLPNHVIQIIGWDDSKQAWLIKNSWGTGWGEGGFGWVGYNIVNIGTMAIWLDARQFNDPCVLAANANPTLIGAGVSFDNAGQGLESQDNYWLYLKLGQSGNNVVGTFSYDNQNQGYSQNQKVPNTLSLGQSGITQNSLQQQGAQFEIDRHGQFGGVHYNSDWNTDISLTLIFNNDTTATVTWNNQKMHCDHNNPYLKWIGQISWQNQSTVTVFGNKITVPAGFAAGPVSMQQTANGF